MAMTTKTMDFVGAALIATLARAAAKAGRQYKLLTPTFDGETLRLTFSDGYFEAAVGLAPGKEVSSWTPVFINDGDLKGNTPLFTRYRWIATPVAAAA
jgi:hypothetical protein